MDNFKDSRTALNIMQAFAIETQAIQKDISKLLQFSQKLLSRKSRIPKHYSGFSKAANSKSQAFLKLSP
jgi:hypothetical protein